MAQSIQVLSDNVVAVDMKYPHLVEAVRNGEIDLDLYRKTMEARSFSLKSEDIFFESNTEINDVDNNHVISKELLDASIVVFITMFVLIILMLILS